MVRFLSIILLLISHSLFSAPPEVRVSLGEEGATEGRPITVHIIISCDRGVEVDSDSFEISGNKLDVSLSHTRSQSSITIINGVKESKDEVITYFTSRIPAKKEGNYVLDPISVKVGDKRISSPSLTYQVYKVTRNTNLLLSSFMDFSGPVFPGQTVTVGYKISINRSLGPIEWTDQDFPLLNLEAFKPKGEVSVSESLNGRYAVKTISQKVQAIKPGSYTLEPGFISGREFRQDFFGQRSYGDILAAKSENLTIELLPFPDEGKPASFNGIIGNFSVKEELVGKSELLLGDKLVLKLEIYGDEHFEDVELPAFHLLPEFKMNFRFNNFLADSQVRDDRKVFIIEMRPINQEVKEIPPISFAFFDPEKQQYIETSTKAIPIKVLASQGGRVEEENVINLEKPVASQAVPKEKSKGFDIFKNLPLSNKTFYDSWSYEFCLKLLILVVALFFTEKFLLNMWNKGSFLPKRYQSEKMLKEAFSYTEDFTVFFALLEKALILRLFEMGHINSNDVSIMDLDDQGTEGKIKEFFKEIDALRYSGKVFEMEKEWLSKSQELYRSIK
ncbi:MAG: BatD family protein [Chlamydiales bacterium]|nr:BatD family protein [Chlamydiales bacterium]